MLLLNYSNGDDQIS